MEEDVTKEEGRGRNRRGLDQPAAAAEEEAEEGDAEEEEEEDVWEL